MLCVAVAVCAVNRQRAEKPGWILFDVESFFVISSFSFHFNPCCRCRSFNDFEESEISAKKLIKM